VFVSVLERVAREREAEIGTMTFDKDDDDALAFVVAASNLRAAAFGVELQSPFAVKGIAGNIVHAIATTNAMVAGLAVLEAIKVVVAAPEDPAAQVAKAVSTYVQKWPTGEPTARGKPAKKRMLLMAESLRPPNPACYVCSKGLLALSVDVDAWTLETLVESLIHKRLAVLEPMISVATGDFHNLLFESGKGLEEDEVEMYEANLGKTLRELRVEDGSQLSVEDCSQCFSCTVIVKHVEKLKKDEALAERYTLEGSVPEAKDDAPADDNDDGDDDDDDECVEVDVAAENTAAVPVLGKKRSADEADEIQPAAKKSRSDAIATDIVIL
jgi:ubiquitin-like 1-activating enzyme E1 B